jgi:hypothetical protein
MILNMMIFLLGSDGMQMQNGSALKKDTLRIGWHIACGGKCDSITIHRDDSHFVTASFYTIPQ